MSSTDSRYWAKVEKTDKCWHWIAARNQNGYGVFSDENGRKVLAHRWSYERWLGPIPSGRVLDHLCRVRNCVNPAHLEPVTDLINARRGYIANKTHCIRGHPFTTENTLKGDGHRRCLECRRMYQRDRLAKKHAKRQP